MNKLAIVVLSVLGTAAAVGSAQADIIYSDPGLHVIDGLIQDNVIIQQDAQVGITGNGTVLGMGVPVPDQSRAAVRVARGELTLQDNARVVAGQNQSAINLTSSRAFVQVGGNAIVDGNIFASGTAGNFRSEQDSGHRVRLQDNAVLNGDLVYGGHVRLQDNARIAGRITNSVHGSVALAMSGGTVDGSVSLGGLDYHHVDLSGGTIRGTLGGASSIMELNMSGGHVAQGIRSQAALSATFSGGQVEGGILVDTQVQNNRSTLLFTGGTYDALANNWLLSVTNRTDTLFSSSIEIRGGQFGYEQSGLGLFLDRHLDFSIYGHDLVFSGGLLSGYLDDGNWFSQSITFGDNWRGNFNIHNVNVPEPGTLALLLMGVVGCAAGRRRVAARTGV